MTLCATGSAANPSAPPYSWITWVEAQSALGTVFSKFSWLAYFLQPVLVQVNTFCSTEPNQPVYPGDSVVASAATDPIAFEKVIQYLKDTATWSAWSKLCQCNASGTPACITQMWNHASTPTSAGPITNEALYCQGHVTVGGETLWGFDIYSPVAQSVVMFWVNISVAASHFENVSLIVGWNRVYFVTPLTMASGDSYRMGFRDTTSATNVSFGYTAGHSHSATSPFVLDGWGTANWDFSGAGLSANDVAIDPVICLLSPAAYTPAAPPVPVTTIPDVPAGPCASIGDLCGILQPTILDISLLKQRLDLLQRRILPFAWIAGTPVTGLTGHGTLTVQDVLGCIVTLTTVPGGWGSTAETPRRLIPTTGSLQASDGTNYDDWRQIHYEHEVYIFDTSWATKINYNFRQGIVATITPIKPEP